ncbi:hypothetical protein HYT58_00500 [Candidatus Woesearchaeota archaeon]|nr:hypothetical protein [Candidatus Woesearchaeota archaeon]
MKTSNYYHSKNVEGSREFAPELVEYRGRRCLILHASEFSEMRHKFGDEGHLVSVSQPVTLPKLLIVAGFIVGDYMKTKEGSSVPVTEVEKIPKDDQENRSGLVELLTRKGEKAPINFWD